MTIPHRSLTYRPELDGLRALAVLLVVFYHFEIAPFRGGYIGVDVFFVISGFLISSIIRAQVEAGTFSFRAFYVRRFRRLIPASITVITLSSLVALALFSSEMVVSQGRLAIASAFSLANVELLLSTGYFDAEAHTKPLLHMWSLSVEEQFYLVWPALLVLGLRFAGRRATPVLIALASVVTVLACVYFTTRMPSAAFYLTPFRMFEFGLGALLLWVPAALERRAAPIAGPVGLVGLLAMGIALTASSPFPGWNALWVALLSAAVILGSRSGVVYWLLTRPSFVQIGLISYSLYLMHWPISVFYRFIVERELTVLDRVALLALTFAGAIALYTWIERPFRSGGGGQHLGRANLLLVTPLYAAVVTFGLLAVVAQGWPERARVAGVLPLTGTAARDIESSYCRAEDPQPLVTCATSTDKPSSIYVWGDSHARHLVGGLATVRPQDNIKVMYRSSCLPLTGLVALPAKQAQPAEQACAQRNEAALRFFDAAPPTTVVIAARWKYYLSEPAAVRNSVASLRDVMAKLREHGHRVVVVGNIVEPGSEVIDCLRSPDTLITPQIRCQAFPSEQERSKVINAELKQVGAGFLDTEPVFCVPECIISVGGELLFRDGHHLSVAGSTRVARAISEAVSVPPPLN